MRPVVQADFGRNAMDVARQYIREGIDHYTRSVMNGQFTEGEYRFQAGIVCGLERAMAALENAEKETTKER